MLIDTGVYGIKVQLNGKTGSITSDLGNHVAFGGLESLVLGHACAGIDITSSAYLEGIETAVDAIVNQLRDA